MDSLECDDDDDDDDHHTNASTRVEGFYTEIEESNNAMWLGAMKDFAPQLLVKMEQEKKRILI